MATPKRATVAAVLASVAGHAILAAVLTGGHERLRAPSEATTSIDVEILPAPVEAPAPVPDGTAEAAATSRTAPSHGLPRPVASSEPMAPASAAPADSGSWSFSPVVPVAPSNLGVWPYRVSSIANAGAPSASTTANPEMETPAHRLDRVMRDELEAHDRAIGLGSGGALISAAHDAASPSLAPDEGSATLEIESDSTGKVLSARVVSASGELSAWNDVARELVRLMAAKPLRVAHDERHRWTRLRIVAERVLPSGESYGRAVGAGSEENCTGSGAERKCGSGMPAGVRQSFDLSDIGAKTSRVVHVQIEGEATR